MIPAIPSMIRITGIQGTSIFNNSPMNHSRPVTNSITGIVGKIRFLELPSLSIKTP